MADAFVVFLSDQYVKFLTADYLVTRN